MKPAELLILDGRHLLWRCVHAYGDLGVELEDGERLDTGAMYGFLLLAKRAHQRYGGLVVVAWEAKTNFRLELFPNYKGRLDQAEKFKEMREAIARGEEPEADSYTRQRFDLGESIEEQQKWLQILLKAMGIRQYMGTHCEADDVMGTLAVGAAKRGRRVVIYTGDSDLLQVVNENIAVVKPGKGGDDEVFTPSDVPGKMGVSADQVADFKALAGDSADKIPGAKGIGKKAAVNLLAEYKNLAGVIEAAEEDDPMWPCSERQRQSIAYSTDAIRMYLRLTKINTAAKLKPRIDPEPDRKKLVGLFRALRFASFLKPSEVRGFLAMGGG